MLHARADVPCDAGDEDDGAGGCFLAWWWCLLCVMLVFSDHCVGADLGYKEGACELSSL